MTDVPSAMLMAAWSDPGTLAPLAFVTRMTLPSSAARDTRAERGAVVDVSSAQAATAMSAAISVGASDQRPARHVELDITISWWIDIGWVSRALRARQSTNSSQFP